MGKHPVSGPVSRVLGGVVLGLSLFPAAFGQSSAPAHDSPIAAAPAAVTPPTSASPPRPAATAATPFPRHATPMSSHAREHYQLLWGVDSLDVKAVESGQMIRFSYYVLDSAKAAQLNDKINSPSLIDEQAGVKLEVPTMEKVGQLRQSSPPEVGKSYWMVFSNKGGLVKPGDRVSVLIGKFKADGLYVR